MYCPTCRQERLGGFAACVVCGAALNKRAREEVLEDLGHVRFVLSDMGKWADCEVPVSARKYVRGRYQQMERVLRTVLETPEGEVPVVRSWQTPVPVPLPVAAPLLAQVPVAPVIVPRAAAEAPPSPPNAPAPVDSVQSDRAEAPFALPVFEIPHTPTPDEQVVEEASKWNEVWKPFLYERIGWFIGAFLILAGSFYFVAVSWSGMSALMQTLVVFGLTAGYSAAFSVGGALLGRRENFDSAGKVLMLIGSAVAPLANLAFQAAGVERIIGVPLSLGWAALAAVLFGIAAKALDAKTQRPLQLLMLVTAASMALSPLVVGGGTAMLWLNAVPMALVSRIWKHDGERSSEASWFVACAPLYLAALFTIRLHVALAAGSALPHVATYAPFVSLLLLNALRLRTLAQARGADALSVAVVTAQVGLLFASAFGEAPALFACCALLGVTTWQLSQGERVARTRWLYGTYIAAQFAYQTCGQLVPGVLTRLIAAAKAALGYAATAPMPFNFDSVVALPCVIAFAVLAARLLKKAALTHDARLAAVAEVLLRSTAGAALLFTAVSFAGRDLRAALWSIPVYALLCLLLGQWLSRPYLVITGAFAFVTTPIFAFNLFGVWAAGIGAGLVALVLAFFSIIQTKQTRGAVSLAAGLLSASAVALGWSAAPPQLAGLMSVVLGGVAGLLVARNLDRAGLVSLWTAVLVSTVPLFFLAFHPAAAPFSVSVAALALALLSSRGDRSRAFTPVTFAAALIAPAWAWVVEVSATPTLLLLGPALVVSGLALLEVGRREGAIRPFGAVLLTLALFAATSLFKPFALTTPLLAAGLLAAAAVLASALSASKTHRATAMAIGLTVVAGAALSEALALLAAGPYVPTVLVASVAVLLTARAVHPSFSVPLASLMALGAFVFTGDTRGLLVQAVILTLIALIPMWRKAHGLLLGEQPVATAASLSAALVLFVCAVKNEPHPSALHLGLFALLPLVWIRATRRAFMALFLAPLMALFVGASGGVSSLLMIVPAVVALATRLVGQLPAARGLVVEGDEARARRVQGFALAGLAAVALAVMSALGLARDVRPAQELVLLSFGAGFVAAGGAPLWLRLVAASVVAAPVPMVRPFLMPALMAVAFLAHHLPKRTHEVLGAPHDAKSPAFIAVLGVVASLTPWLTGWASNGEVILTASALLAASVVLDQRWMIPAAFVLTASAGAGLYPVDGSWLLGGLSAVPFALVALVGAVCSALLANDGRNERAQAMSHLVAPGFHGDLHLPLWFGGLLPAVIGVLLALSEEASSLGVGAGLLMFAAAVLLLVTRDRVQTVMATALGSAVVMATVPAAWAPFALASFGVVLAVAGAWFEDALETADALHHCGWVTTLVAALFCRALHHLATPLTFGAIAAAAWVVVWRRREREVFGWTASLLFGHVLLFHLGVVLSTGKPPQYIFPYISMLSAVMAAVVGAFASERLRRTLTLWFGVISLVESFCGVLLLPLGPSDVAMREALIAAFGMGVLVVALVRHAVKENDVVAAYLAQVAMLMGYFAVRAHGMVPHAFGTNDAIASLIAGAFFSGLYVWARRQDEAHVFVKPAWVGAVGLPLLGLLAAPWESPMVVACLLMANAAHFAVAARITENKRGASLLATAAFNAALVFMWLGTGFGRPQYYVIPAALSMLVLVRVFKDDFTAEVEARLRAISITAIYLAAAWPMLFENTWQMLLCAALCVVGVAVGVAMRVRSYVYLGTGFLVSSIVANLIRFGVRDPRLGALFLSLLGLMIVGFMIYLTARRADVLRQYRHVRNMLQTWEA